MKFIDKELLLFDLDGTLIDSAPDLALSINYMLSSIEYQEFPAEVIDTWVGNGAQTLVKRALSGSKYIDESIDNDFFEKALSIFLDYYKDNCCVETVPYPHVNTTLQSLKDNGYRMAIVTNKPFDFIEPILKTLELLEFFEAYIGGDSLAEKKPSPEPLLYLCKKYNVDISKALMIGDSKNDILAAQAAKVQTIAVSYGYNYGEDIKIYKPDITVDDFADILKSLT